MHRVWRAAGLSFYAMGTTLLGLIGLILTATFLLIKNGWSNMIEHWKRTGASALVLWWFLVFLYLFTFISPETFSVEEIKKFSQGIVVNIASNNFDSSLIGTGFWIDKKGHIITCSDPQKADLVLNNSNFRVGVMVPPLLTGKMLTVVLGVNYTSGEIVYYDSETGIFIIYVNNNPFMRKLHMFAEAENVETHQKESTTEKYWVPALSKDLVSVGSQIFLAAVERDKEGPAINFLVGRVVKRGADTSRNKYYLRIYTDIPFKASYRGSPVLDATKSIVGVACSESETISVLIPSQSLVDIIAEAKCC